MHGPIQGYIGLACSVVLQEVAPNVIRKAVSIASAHQTGSHPPKRTDVPIRFQANA